MPIKRSKILYFFMIIGTIGIGLFSRSNLIPIPQFIHAYLGDILYSFMIYLIIGFIFPQAHPIKIALISTFICYSIELSQLYHADWIDNIRMTKLGRLILGVGFLWSDLISYFIGGLAGIGLEWLMYKKRNQY